VDVRLSSCVERHVGVKHKCSFNRWVNMPLVEVLRPNGEPELMAVVAMLDAHQIPCHVHNAGYGSLFPGPAPIPCFQRVIMVPEERVSDALELIRDFQSQPIDPDPA
jgi:Putative prokaryotic signal transducing protein